MTKSLAFVVTGLVAASALAAVVTIGSHGRGRAETRDGRVGTFNFEVARKTDGEAASTFGGRLRFEQRANRRGPFVLIEMGRPDQIGLSRTGNVCEFGGPGSLVRLVEGRRVTVQGRVEARTEDRRTPERPRNERDKFRVRFQQEGGLTFEFDGLVDEGDLVVFRRQG